MISCSVVPVAVKEQFIPRSLQWSDPIKPEKITVNTHLNSPTAVSTMIEPVDYMHGREYRVAGHIASKRRQDIPLVWGRDRQVPGHLS